ncbi:MAG: tetratricopeptide repeat protein [Syntrophobacterales bacterium]|jgi:tetratricopeptide (TPR) repeat protein|nr:tetratricopeptide repeat protein [Syntrophobacterales bacterium]
MNKSAPLCRLLLSFGLAALLALSGCNSGTAPQSPKSKEDLQATVSPKAFEHFREAHKLLKEQKFPEALREFQQAAELAPKSALVQFWVGKTAFLNKDKDLAEKSFLKVLELEPTNYHAKAMLGQLYSLDKTKLDQAESYLKEALDASPDNLEAHFDLGRVYALKGDKEQTLQEFRFVFAKESEFPGYHFEMGRIMESWGEKQVALNHYRRALMLNPRFEAARQAVQKLESSGPGAAQPAPTPAKPKAAKPK